MTDHDCWCIYDGARYIGLAYGLSAARAAYDRGLRVVPYLDHVAPECRPDAAAPRLLPTKE